MIHLPQCSHKSYVVLGLARTGIAVVSAMLASDVEQIYLWDDKPSARANIFADLGLSAGDRRITVIENEQDFTKLPWPSIAACVTSPGIPFTHPAPHPMFIAAKSQGCPIIGDTELFYQAQSQARFIGITGTNGKSTTSSLIYHLLSSLLPPGQVAFGGNIGIPVLMLPSLAESRGTFVLEMSSYHLDLNNTMHFHVAVLLNMSEHHLDRHGDMENYIQTKLRIFKGQRYEGAHPDVAIIGYDSPITRAIYEQRIAEYGAHSAIPVSAIEAVKGGVAVVNGEAIIDLPQCRGTYTLSPLPQLAGNHNAENIAAAIAVALFSGMRIEMVLPLLPQFKSLPHRLEYLGSHKGVAYVNDSKATNATAAEKALLSYDAPLYWIAGGRPDIGGIASLAPLFSNIRHAFLIGEATDLFATECGGRLPYSKCETLDQALLMAKQLAEEEALAGSVVLFSPACASFDQFKNFEHRGDVFRDLVTKAHTLLCSK
jgi:UDP-N-acetylmuramoylalanine--D-glutamate ligase